MDSRSRLGDWEADTSVGKGQQQAIVSRTERKSKLTLLAKVEQATAEAVEEAMTRLLQPMARRVNTSTSDHGREFARHQQIASKLQADFYFAHPYASWQRGLLMPPGSGGLMRTPTIWCASIVLRTATSPPLRRRQSDRSCNGSTTARAKHLGLLPRIRYSITNHLLHLPLESAKLSNIYSSPLQKAF